MPAAGLRRAAVVLVVLGAVVVPTVAVVRAASGPGRLDGITDEARPVVVRAGREVDDGARLAVATLSFADGPAVRAPAWDGLVTSVAVAPGQVVTDGTPLLVVDGVTRVAVRSDAPFFRPLAEGDTGPDVAALEAALRRAGDLRGPADDRFDAATAAAVARWGGRLGAGAPTTFDPALVLWLPVDELVAGTVGVAAGAPAPTPGEPVVAAVPSLARAALTTTDGEPLGLATDGAWVAELAGVAVAVDPATGLVAAGDLPRLAAVVAPGTATVELGVRRAAAVEAVTVPATAVTTGPGGALCVWLPDGGGFRPRPVVPAASVGGRTRLAGGLDAGTEVLANPAAFVEPSACR